MFEEVWTCLNNMQFTKEELTGVFAMTSAALLLGELDIDDSNCNPDKLPEDGLLCCFSNRDILENIADLLKYKADDI